MPTGFETKMSESCAVVSGQAFQTLNWRVWFESVSIVDKVLSQDPAGIYLKSDLIINYFYMSKKKNKTDQETA